jgi:type III secretory pathway component EscV
VAVLVAFLAAATLALLAGAMLLIAVAIAPFWAALEPAEFTRVFRESASLIGQFMLPLGASSTVLVIVAAVLARMASSPSFPWFTLAAALAVAVAGIYPLYFTSANASLAGGSLDASQVAAELGRWRGWHWARTGAGVVGFLAALRGLALSIK